VTLGAAQPALRLDAGSRRQVSSLENGLKNFITESHSALSTHRSAHLKG
jgi:hypothetical protein